MAKNQKTNAFVNGNTIDMEDTWTPHEPEQEHVTETLEYPEPVFSEIEPYLSEKPLQFNPNR